jgi:DNA-binding transcriptional MerR regulator/methylmalonyl-CoA mutase cobalamin-binding subunit
MAAEMTGVSEGLIRAWERRYGVLKPRRTPSGYRAYTQADIEVLKRLKKLTEEGVAIAEAVRLLPRIRREAKEHVEGLDSPRKPPQEEQFAKWRQEVLVAAERLDQQAIEAVLDEAMGSMPPVAFFEEVVFPLQREVGDRWHDGRLTVAEEHLVTQASRQRVLTLLHQAPRRAKRHVVCACFPTEDHELGLMGVALKFRHAGWRVTFLGARTPPEHLARVVKAVSPELVALSAVSPKPEEVTALLQQIIEALPEKTKVVIGGAAALGAKAAVTKLGVRFVETADEWEQLLD